MKNIKELRLGDQEFQEDKSFAIIEILSKAFPTKKPEVTFVVAQPGAGKTGLALLSSDEIQARNNGTKPVEVNSDLIATYNRNDPKLLDYKPAERMEESRRFVNPIISEVQNILSNNNVSMVIECTLNSTKKIDFMKKLKEKGYRVNIKIMAVDELESRLSCLERETKLLKLRQKSRPIDKKIHDDCYYNMLSTLELIIPQNCWDSIAVYKRGKSLEKPIKIYETAEIGDFNVIHNIKLERARQRENILSYSSNYKLRLDKAERLLKVWQKNEALKEFSLNNLENLRLDFEQELENTRPRR